MAQPKRIKSSGKSSKQHVAAKQAAKKKSKGAAKYHNEQLRSMLDTQTSTLYSVRAPVNQLPQPKSQSLSKVPVVDVQDLTSTLGRL
ncbi:hypothetical protein H0H93_015164 [Arthromyces matolae]|nr:hypothetical protein H0H93_015164 [Arthromyces matolae]